MDIVDQMKLFLEPKSVAVIGASRQTGPGSWNIIENILNIGFSRKIYPVNPNTDRILGIKCYPNVKEIPDDVELAVIATPRSTVPQMVKECCEKKIKAIIIVTQGFADSDEEGKKLQAEIIRIARKGGARILGPNTFGTANAFTNFTSAFVPFEMKKIPIGIICQTGFLFVGIPEFPMVGKGIDLGNACDVNFADGLEYFEDDPEIKVILLHIEGIRDGKRFMNVAERVSKKKPIIVLKTGRSNEGARAAQSHTGSMVGNDEVYNAAFRQCGVIRADDADEFCGLSKAFLRLPSMKGKGVGIITWTGAAGIMTLDACARYNLHLAKLSPGSLMKISTLAPPWQSVGNPADIWPAVMISKRSMDEVMSATLQAFLADQNVYGIIMIFAGFLSEFASTSSMDNLFGHAVEYEKPIVCWLYGTEVESVANMVENAGTVVVYRTLEQAVKTLARLNEYWERNIRRVRF